MYVTGKPPENTLDTETDTPVAEYRYDGLGRRIRKIVEGSPDVTYDYYYNEGRQVLEVWKNGDDDHPLEQYVWDGRYVHSPALRWRDGNCDGDYADEGDSILYYCNDANFNVTALVDAASGAVVERYWYEPYGQVHVCAADWTPRENNASAYSNEILFTGHRLDPETGLYSTPFRYYHPTLCWIQRDPAGYVDGMNVYEYVASNPLVFADEFGMAGAGTPSGAAKPGTQGGCPCADEPDKCKIQITLAWLIAPRASWSSHEQNLAGEGAKPFEPPGTKEQPRTIVIWTMTFEAQLSAVVVLTHTENDPKITCCHLRQDVEGKANWDVGRKLADDARFMSATGRKWVPGGHPFKKDKKGGEPYIQWRIEKDYNSGFIGKQPKGKETYFGWHYSDEPSCGAQADFQRADELAKTLRYWWQAHVSVEEAPKVENWYGFEASNADWKNPASSPQANGQFWKDTKKDVPKWD